MIWVLLGWLILMASWLFGYGMWHFAVKDPSVWEFTFVCILPWLCVLLVGLTAFSAVVLVNGALR